MLSYQHGYHAGNHADVLKHILLGDVVAGMQRKDTPMMMLDGFAGRGLYDLNDSYAQKTGEAATGIQALDISPTSSEPEGVKRWKTLVQQHNPNQSVRYYPGSTAILSHLARPQDRVLACDLHPQEFQALRQNFQSHRRFSLHQKDAYEALRAFLPPKEKRGLVFLDPSFEEKDEYRRLADAVIQAYPHFRAGVYMMWYPLLPAGHERELFRAFQQSGIRKILRVELEGDFPDMQMRGSGLLIINPPWHAEQHMQASLDWMKKSLYLHQVNTRYRWLVPE